MRALAIANLAGVVLAAVFAGTAIGGGYTPMLSSLAALAFLAGIFIPFLGEHLELQRGLERIEREFLAQRRREMGMTRYEVFSGRRARPIWRNGGPSRVPAALAAATGVALLGADVVLYLLRSQAEEAIRRTISNF